MNHRRDSRLERNFHLESDFRDHAAFLGQLGAISLAELSLALSSGVLQSRATVITFDDGYANNLLAAEILSEAGLPCTIFVSTGAVGRNKAIWTVELSLLLLHGHAAQIEVLGRIWSLATREEREAAFQGIRFPLKAMPASFRRKTMDEILAQFPEWETERLLEQFPSFQMLTWVELRQLADAGVEIGSHGVDHELHHTAQDPEVRRRELAESKNEIEQRLGRPCRFFGFPNGDFCDLSPKEVEAAGYDLAFTTASGSIRPDSNPFLLPRVSPGGSVAKLKQQLKRLR